jgi:hypothetical protein
LDAVDAGSADPSGLAGSLPKVLHGLPTGAGAV